jgi:formate/nitrite transporter FocA (FNT family)
MHNLSIGTKVTVENKKRNLRCIIMGIAMDYSWVILGTIIGGFIFVSLMTQFLNRNPAE